MVLMVRYLKLLINALLQDVFLPSLHFLKVLLRKKIHFLKIIYLGTFFRYNWKLALHLFIKSQSRFYFFIPSPPVKYFT